MLYSELLGRHGRFGRETLKTNGFRLRDREGLWCLGVCPVKYFTEERTM